MTHKRAPRRRISRAAPAPGAVVLLLAAVWLAGCGGSPGAADAGPVRVAAAANFMAAQESLAARFTQASGFAVTSSFGSTGALYTQVVHGAPFHVFLSADDARPEQLVRDGLAPPGGRFTYALGELALYAPGRLAGGDGERLLRDGEFTHLAVCKPALAPYGLAAHQTLERLGLAETLQGKIVHADNVAQAFQFVESGNAEAGFVALSQVYEKPPTDYWRVPAAWHEPIRQDAVLLPAGADHPGAAAFLEFLRGPEGRTLIAASGYGVPADAGR